VHNLTKDPPFSKLDLLSSRNLLIYFDTPLQRRLVQTFHYALKPSGYLFLGTSENLTRHGGLFTVLDNKHQLFQRRDDVATALSSRLLSSQPAQSNPAVPQSGRISGDDIDRRAREVLEKHSPAYVVINRQQEVLRFSGGTGQYIEHSQGAASLNLFGIVRKDLLPAVRDTVREAMTARRQVIRENLFIAVNDHSKIINLIVEPISAEADEELYLVAFQDRGLALPESEPGPTSEADNPALEKELRAARAQLESTISDLETANEELKSANEEYQSVNEEFQSSNEELESSKEELQSMNEFQTSLRLRPACS
jgi:two-component system, chemotaxis family, CheB/CheR fusion protein